jgi:Zn-dependent peptidase ImmA (M78 family)
MPFTTQEFAQKLSSLRQSFGNSMNDLTEATGIDSRRLQAFESGSTMPSGDEILILSDFFKCEFTWLIEDHESNPDENIILMLRSEGGRLAASDRHAIAEFLHLCKSQALLEELLEIKPLYAEFVFTPKGKSYKRQGEECAKNFREWHRLAFNAVVPDIFKWLRKSGFRVFRRDLPSSPISGLFIRHPYAGKCILINYAEDIYRQRFSAAHEAGHALMDADISFNVSDQSDKSSQVSSEIRANSFASCFLMPNELLTKLGTPEQLQQPEKIMEVANLMSVSIPALLSALRRDKIIDEQTRLNLRNMRLRLPIKNEPELAGDLSKRQLERKKALLAAGLNADYVSTAFEAHYRKLISLAKLADILLVDTRDVTELADIFGMSLRHD